MAKRTKPDPDDGLVAAGETGKMEVERRADEKIGRTMARITLDPQTRNANLAMAFGSGMFGDQHRPDIIESRADATALGMTSCEPTGSIIGKRAAGNAGIGFLSVADLARLVNVLMRQADVGDDGRKSILSWNTFRPAGGHLAPLLRRVIFVGQAALGEAFNFKRVGLRADAGTGFLGVADSPGLVDVLVG